MKLRLLGAVLAAGACRSTVVSGQPAAIPEPIPVTRFDDRIAGFSQTSGFDDATRLVVRDTTAWRSAWVRLNARFFPQPPLPTIDFSRETVLIAAMGERASGGFEIHLDSILRRPDAIEVSVRSVVPGDGCMLSATFTQPVDVAKIPASPLPVRFRERNVTASCTRRERVDFATPRKSHGDRQ
jgi:hypothetical protein